MNRPFIIVRLGQLKSLLNGYIYVFKNILASNVSANVNILRSKNSQFKTVKPSVLDELVGQNNKHIHPPLQKQIQVTKAKASKETKSRDYY